MHKKLFILPALFLLGLTGCKNKTATTDGTVEKAQTVAENAERQEKMSDGVRTIAIDSALNGRDAFEAIKKNYTGRVAFVDFWATWCPPCRAAMREVDQIKPELEKQGAVFVYITGETSPEAEWKNSIPTIHGDHYRLTDKQWTEIMKNFNIPGIPSYCLIDAKGNMTYNNFNEGGYPGNEAVKQLVTKALGEK